MKTQSIIKQVIGLTPDCGLTHAERTGLLYMATYANPKDGTQIFPSISRLAREMWVTERHVKKILRALILKGYLIIARLGGGKYKSNIYHIPLDQFGEICPKPLSIEEYEAQFPARGKNRVVSSNDDFLDLEEEEPRQPAQVRAISSAPSYRYTEPGQTTPEIEEPRQPAQVALEIEELRQPAQVALEIEELRQPAQVALEIEELRQPAQVALEIEELRQPAQVALEIEELRQPAQAALEIEEQRELDKEIEEWTEREWNTKRLALTTPPRDKRFKERQAAWEQTFNYLQLLLARKAALSSKGGTRAS